MPGIGHKNILCCVPYEFTRQQGVLQQHKLFCNRKMPYPCDDIERYGENARLWGNYNSFENYECIDIEFLRDYLVPAKEFIESHSDGIKDHAEALPPVILQMK